MSDLLVCHILCNRLCTDPGAQPLQYNEFLSLCSVPQQLQP